MEFNPVDRLGALVLPWGARTLHRYDSNGLLTEMTNAREKRSPINMIGRGG